MFVTPEIQARYLGRRESDIATIQDALEKGDYKMVAKLGHDWKGNGETYGFPEFSRWGQQLEAAAMNQQAEEIRQMMQQIRNFIDERKS